MAITEDFDILKDIGRGFNPRPSPPSGTCAETQADKFDFMEGFHNPQRDHLLAKHRTEPILTKNPRTTLLESVRGNRARTVTWQSRRGGL